ncbi:hypothetical protein POM88_018390 [Heracleum sosnowskyi]|uniref:Short-chain dehydrogenase/reductase n=1 Tax=Heracleum sosnowskyi TaxID=360622 RepID=A0AAD8MZ77_9APIA|nr:hypothetical protein POM88_018390 [Heracleum sosnowskyi]
MFCVTIDIVYGGLCRFELRLRISVSAGKLTLVPRVRNVDSKAFSFMFALRGASRIGLETARVLALRKAHVIIAARNVEAANEAKQLILKDQENARIDVLKLDLCSIKSVRAFADSFKALNLPLNILIRWDRDTISTNHLELLKLVTPLIWKNVPQGAATTCYVALHHKLKGVSGKYYQDCNEWQPSKFATDEKLAKKLWDFSREP